MGLDFYRRCAGAGAAGRARLPVWGSLALAAWLATGCGGGGGSSGITVPASAAAPARTYVPPPADAIGSSELSQNQCHAPRTGTDPGTRQPFADRFGGLAEEKSWVRAWIDETYLWFDEIPSTISAASFATPQTFFDALRTPALTPSGRPKDRFHFSYDTAVWQALSQGGVASGYGFEAVIVQAAPPRDVRIAYTEPDTPATAAGITRGDRVLEINGVDVLHTPEVEALNAGLFPKGVGESNRFKLQAPDRSLRTVVLTSAAITHSPVQAVRTIDTPTGKVGYLLFNDHLARSEAQLIAAVTQLKAEGVQDLVLDLRYNGGGLLDVASELAYMVAGPAATAGATFERLQFNTKNPFGLSEAQTRTPFHTQSRGFSAPAGQPLPQLGLSRVTVLSGPGTCSASESIINGLRGVDVTVTVVGETTCGKPYGFSPQGNCGTTYFAVQFSGVNHKGFGDYADGLAPTCTVPDDFSRALGDPAEQRLAAALAYRATGSCPPVVNALQKSGPRGLAGEALLSGKSRARTERVLDAGALQRR